MTVAVPGKGQTRLAYVLVAICFLLYSALSLLAPRTTNPNFQLSDFHTIILQLSIIVPVLFIWSFATGGAMAFKRYATLIKGSRDAHGINSIADGLIWSVAYLILIALIGALVPYFAHTNAIYAVIAVRNHLPTLVTLVAFILLYRGSHDLKRAAQFTTWTPGTIAIAVLFAIFAAGFTWIFAASPASIDTQGVPTYALPPRISIFTFITPLLVSWFLGLIAAINITKYSRGVKGIIYKQALRDVVRGIIGVIVFAIVLQITTFSSRVFAGLNLQSILLILYLLLVLYGIGFWFIRRGAKKLSRIEIAK